MAMLQLTAVAVLENPFNWDNDEYQNLWGSLLLLLHPANNSILYFIYYRNHFRIKYSANSCFCT